MEKSPKHIYKRFRESMMAKSSEWKDLLAEDVVLNGPLSRVKGRAAFIEVNEPFFASILQTEMHELVVQDDRVITRISTVVDMPGGDPVTLSVSEWYTIEGGLITSLNVYFDTADFRAALGM